MNDDVEMARLLTRRRALGLLGAAGAVLLAGGRTWDVLAEGEAASPLPACIVSPEQTEGPYFVDEKLNRSDIRSDPTSGAVKKGVPFQLTIRVYRINHNGCSPIKGAYVDLWHCDASGFYSDVRDPGFQTVGKKFLRGYQVTDDGGSVKFLTIYPGWYPGRTVHIHFKVRIRRSFFMGL